MSSFLDVKLLNLVLELLRTIQAFERFDLQMFVRGSMSKTGRQLNIDNKRSHGGNVETYPVPLIAWDPEDAEEIFIAILGS